MRALLLAALLTWLPAIALAAGPARLADGAEITVPEGYSHAFEDDGKTIVLHPPRKGLFEYRVTFRSLVEHLAQRPNVVEEFVAAIAKKKGRPLLAIRGSSHKGFVEPGPGSMVDGEPARNLHGVVAMKEGYASMTLTVPERHANDPFVREFVEGGMEALLATLKYAGTRP